MVLFQYEELQANRDCMLECGPDKQCYIDTCCAIQSKKGSPEKDGIGGLVDANGIRQRVGAVNSGGTGDCALNDPPVNTCPPEQPEQQENSKC